MLTDSHCHLDRLDLDALGGNIDAVMETARAHGVGQMLCVCINLENYPDVLAFAHQYEHVHASVGVHPNETEGEEPTLDQLVSLANDERVVAIGETGLDYYYNKGDMSWQQERFRVHINAARASRLPLIIHTRDAWEDTYHIMEKESVDQIGGVMHCFTGNWEQAKRALDLGFYISFSGIVTFKNAEDLQEVARKVPDDRYIIETDSPYLTPVPYRGKPNQPAFVRYVGECLASLRNLSLESLAEQTNNNYNNIFNKI
ncbi:MAG: TatD family hydrolase [Gammaproteobacteria bacterium]